MVSSPSEITKSPSRQSSGGSTISSIAEEGDSIPSSIPRRQNSYGLVAEPPQEMEERDDAQSVLSRSSTTRTLVSPYQPRTSREYQRYGYGSLNERSSYLEEPYSSSGMHKSLPVLPQGFSNGEGGMGYDYGRSHHTRYDLVSALGEDNIEHTTELDTIPCAGIMISSGNLKGLMAWRLVVRIGGKEGRFPKAEISFRDDFPRSHSKSSSSHSGKFALSSSSESDDETYHGGYDRRSLQMPTFSKKPLPSISPGLYTPPAGGFNAVTANFILDTSQYRSSIPRETLVLLGFKAHDLHPSKPVFLRVQGVETRFCVGRDGEAGRLGVQFLEDANVSLAIDKEVGPVFYGETSQLRDVPRTVRLSLQQRVRSLFGMNRHS